MYNSPKEEFISEIAVTIETFEKSTHKDSMKIKENTSYTTVYSNHPSLDVKRIYEQLDQSYILLVAIHRLFAHIMRYQ
jgi:hypothetical protein